MLSFFLGVPDPHLGVMRLVIIVGMVYGIIFGFLNSPLPLLPPPPAMTMTKQSTSLTMYPSLSLTCDTHQCRWGDREQEGGYTGNEIKIMLKS
jgi:hypothetical protein